MMDLSSSMTTLGVRQLAAVVGEPASRQATGAALRMLRLSTEGVRAVLPADEGLAWRELGNKLETFEDFQQVRSRLGLPPAGFSLEGALRRVSELGAYGAVWATEGLGYARAEEAWAAGRPPRWLLREPGLEGLPARAVLPLHTGAALAFARRLLDAGGARDAAALERWLAVWEDNARPGWRPVAVEALGLLARNLHPYLVPGLDARLGRLDPVLAEHFWHGVGRGLYFAPTQAVPFLDGTGRALEKAAGEPPNEAGRRNATAGVAFALTLVNFRHPQVLAGVLERCGGRIGAGDAFSSGVASAAVTWSHAAGRDACLAGFLGHRPSRPGLAERWNALVLVPCEDALRRSLLRQGPEPADLFRCRASREEVPGS